MFHEEHMLCIVQTAAERMTNVVTESMTDLQVSAVLRIPCTPCQSRQRPPGGGPLLHRGSGGTRTAGCNMNQSAGTCLHAFKPSFMHSRIHVVDHSLIPPSIHLCMHSLVKVMASRCCCAQQKKKRVCGFSPSGG